METNVEAKRQWHDIKIEGKFKIVYTPTGPHGQQGFGGIHIPSYPSPFDGKNTMLRTIDDKPANGFILDSIEKVYTPDSSIEDKYKVSWLICHPGIKLDGFKKGQVDQKILDKKKGGKITLIAMDQKEFADMDEDDYIDRLVGKISMDAGSAVMGIDKIRVILAALNIRHRDPRYKGVQERKVLRTKLKKYVRSSYKNAQQVNKILKDIEGNTDAYNFKEMVNQGIITYDNSVYKYINTILGRHEDQVILFLNTNVEVKTEMVAKMKENLK
jgi:hypothetical protein